MLIHVPLDHIDDNPFQQRQEYGDIEDLAGRIAAARTSYPDSYGLMQIPRGRLVVRNGRYPHGEPIAQTFSVPENVEQWDPALKVQLAFGHRRLRAFRHLHQSGAPGYEDGRFPVHVDPLGDEQMLDAVWAENRERKDIAAVEEAELLQEKIARLGSQAAAASAWGLARSTVANRLRLLQLPAAIQDANRRGALSERQALSLAPLIRIQELVDGQVRWADKLPTNAWDKPASADTVIAAAIANPDAVTSEVIRDQHKRMIDHAGEKLPAWLATVKFDEGGDVVQAQCKGCAYRINQSCLRPACLRAKLAAWPEMAVAAFVTKSGIPRSNADSDFIYQKDARARERILALYRDGETDNLVCAWRVGSYEARPHGQSAYVYSPQDEKDGRCGIALGYRGELPQTAEIEEASPYDLPESAEIDAWKQQATAIEKRVASALRDALVDNLLVHVAGWDALQAMVVAPDDPWSDEAPKRALSLVNFCIKRGSGLIAYYGSDYEAVQAYRQLAARARLGVNLLDDHTGETAVLILSYWYGRCASYFWEGVAERALAWIDAWLDGAAPGAPLQPAILRAQRHAQEKLAREGRNRAAPAG